MNELAQVQLSNWGRWGAEAERGSLNLITPELIKRASINPIAIA